MNKADVLSKTAVESVLVSYVVLKKFLESREKFGYPNWVLDSGAYSVLSGAKTIDLHAYIDDCRRLLETDATLQHVFALDVIGDPEASARNTETMWDEGIPAIPTFHQGSPWHYLSDLSAKYEKIALGGLVARTKSERGNLTWGARKKFFEGCFARIWPKWIHGFGCTDRRVVLEFPFAEVDSTSWIFQVARYGACQFISKNGRSLLPSAKENPSAFAAAIRTQVQFYLKLQEQVRVRFGRVLAAIGIPPFTLRFVVSGPELEYLQRK